MVNDSCNISLIISLQKVSISFYFFMSLWGAISIQRVISLFISILGSTFECFFPPLKLLLSIICFPFYLLFISNIQAFIIYDIGTFLYILCVFFVKSSMSFNFVFLIFILLCVSGNIGQFHVTDLQFSCLFCQSVQSLKKL